MQIIVDILGWAGAVLYLIAYALVSLRKLEGDSFFFQSFNIVAGVMLIINTYYYRAYPSAALNAAWLGIAIFTLARKNRSSQSG